VTATDLHVTERHGGDREVVESFALLPASDDQFILPTTETEPALSHSAKQRFGVGTLLRKGLFLSIILIFNHKLKSLKPT
jgi:hypothetical protein